MIGGILSLGFGAVKTSMGGLASILDGSKNVLLVMHFWACARRIRRNIRDSESPKPNSIE
ncbi:MAG TPA: hypothetical protein VHQ87_12025 [Rhizobacter sp.]|nr:hypothetical protein [Rhizobacter sp.]